VRREHGLHVFLTGNTRVGEPSAAGQFHAEDSMEPGTLATLSTALDDLRALGELDLRLNHGLALPAKR
jgi:hypothetical protein